MFIEILDEYFDIAAKLLHVHRIDILQKRIEKTPNYLKFFGALGWFNLDTMFSTFGIQGIYEATQFMGHDILDDNGTEFALDLLQYVKSKVIKYRKKYNCVFNTEEIPGEQACVTLLQKDKLIISNEIVNDDAYDILSKCNLYSNQYIPLINNADIITRLDLSGRFMKMVSGGGIVHANIDSQIDTDGKMLEIMKLAAKSGVPHIAICYKFGKCEDHKATIVGRNIDKCPICGKPIIHTRMRVIGYFSDIINWHPVRQKYDAPNRYFSGEKELVEI